MGWVEDKVERLIDRYVKRDERLRDRIRRMERASNENCKTDSKNGAGQMTLSVGAGEGNRTLDIQLGKLTFYL